MGALAGEKRQEVGARSPSEDIPASGPDGEFVNRGTEQALGDPTSGAVGLQLRSIKQILIEQLACLTARGVL